MHNPSLQRSARVRAEEIAEKFSHTRPNGSTCFTAITIRYSTAGENIAMGHRSPEAVMRGWIKSDGHRKNLLNDSFNSIGVGCYEEDGVIHWAQMFVKTR